MPTFFFAILTPAFADLTLFYNQPATDWQTQALPIGNGRLGAMIFGDPQHEHVQINEISLWTGDEKNLGAYQNLGDLTFDLVHGPATSYRRELDISSAIHTITYTADGIPYKAEYFASEPRQALIFHYEAGEKKGAYSGLVKFADSHNGIIVVQGNKIFVKGTLDNGLVYEAEIAVLHTGGKLTSEASSVRVDSLRVTQADSLTIVVL
ncbi:MAG TPA: glycoside hydrolase family 95 protein, partial [Bryobacteraceae bacterium]